ncbi:hypothetical protein SAMN04487760_10518 [Lachnospiraceae bacterium G41]|nr:hypothetical protein SAMN04487760_10518 [Lachnospiraceae bacterium G41]
MLEYKLKEKTEEKITFYFYPEGSKRPGEVVFYSDGKIEITMDSPDDVKRYYAGHAVTGINKEKTSGYIIWM